MSQYHKCPRCEAHLDPSERCDECERQEDIPQNGDLVLCRGDEHRPLRVVGTPYLFGGKLVADCKTITSRSKNGGQIGMYLVENLSPYKAREGRRPN